MKNFPKLFLLITGFTSMVACTTTKEIQKNMNSRSYSMAYIMDSEISHCKNNITVKVDTVFFNPREMSDTTKVKREKGWCVPLIFVNIWNSKNKCSQGKSMLEEDIPSFLKMSLTSEINRSGKFLVDSLSSADYTIELSIDKIKTEGPYVSSGGFYFLLCAYGFWYSDVAGPALSYLKVSYQLKKDGQVVLSNAFSLEKVTEQINKRYTNQNLLQQDYAISMVEAVSYNLKNTIELIVNDLNVFLQIESTNKI